MIAFEDIEKKYLQARECMADIIQAVSTDNYPPHATWIHPPAMARWLYLSSCEFLKDYTKISGMFRSENVEQSAKIDLWRDELDQKVNHIWNIGPDRFIQEAVKRTLSPSIRELCA
ncbi:MAG: hypothetical protein AABX07_02105 [Nanoarchaeota archaeon]